MPKTSKLSKKLVAARKKRNWSVEEAAKRAGLHHYALRNLEGSLSGRIPPDGGDVRVRTMVELVRVYWPDLQIDDFCEEEDLLAFAPRGGRAKEKLLWGRSKAGS